MRRIRQCLIFSFLMLFSVNGCSQDFSFEEFVNERDDMRKIELGILGATIYRRDNLDSLLPLALAFADSEIGGNENLQNRAFSWRYLGSYFIRTTEIDKGIEYLYKARDEFSKLELRVLESETENELGNAFFQLGNYNKATVHYLASIEKGAETIDRTAAYNGMIGFGKVLCAAGDTAKGVLFVQKYLQNALRDKKFEAASDACGFLGMIAGARGNVDLMSAYYNRAIRYANQSNSKTHKANSINNRAIDFFYQNKGDSAIAYFKRALELREAIGNTRSIIESYYNLAIVYIELEDFDMAMTFASKGEALSGTAKMRTLQIDCIELMIEIAETTGQSEIVSKLNIELERIKVELKEVDSVDDQVIEAAMHYAAIKPNEQKINSYSELIAILSIITAALTFLLLEKSNSVSGGTRA